MPLNRAQLIAAIMLEMERVWGPQGFGGEPEEYGWLEWRYQISEEEDVQWQLILEYQLGELREEDLEDDQLMQFLENNFAVVVFLEDLLRKYRSSVAEYPT